MPIPPPSTTALIWQPGHYDWDGMHYLWVRGEWIEGSGETRLWRDGFWDTVNKQPVWVPGRWL